MSFYGKDSPTETTKPLREFRVYGVTKSTTVEAHAVWFMDGGYVAFVNNPGEDNEFIVHAVARHAAPAIEEVPRGGEG